MEHGTAPCLRGSDVVDSCVRNQNQLPWRIPRRARAAALGFALTVALCVLPAASQEVATRASADLWLDDVVDSLSSPDGRLKVGDMEFALQRDARAKGGVVLGVNLWPRGVIPYVGSVRGEGGSPGRRVGR
jgi:hypothetical protein